MTSKHKSICPWQAGTLLASPIRKIFQEPNRILKPHISKGMTVVETGCAMGYFTIPIALLAEREGKVIAVDLQQEMLDGLLKRAKRKGVSNIAAHLCAPDSLRLDDMKERADFAFVFWMLHEVPDQKRLIGEARSVLAAKGRLLFGEPVGHVSEREYLKSAELFCAVGFKQIETLNIPFSRAVLFEK